MVSAQPAKGEAWTMPVKQRTLKAREIFHLSFRSPELGQPFWSFLLLSCRCTGAEVSNPKVKTSQKPDSSTQAEPVTTGSMSTFSEEEIRIRAYQIYESRDRTHNNPDEDWSQADTELMELAGGK
jgi:hypothetical protein